MKQIIFLSFLFWAINCDVTPMIISICPVKGGDTPIYEIDLSNTYSDPDPIEKGATLTLYEDGIMNADEWVKDLCYIAYLEGKIIDRQCYVKDEPASSGDEYSLEWSTDVPAFVPPGHWEIHLILRNDAKKELGCLKATYNIDV